MNNQLEKQNKIRYFTFNFCRSIGVFFVMKKLNIKIKEPYHTMYED